MECRPEELEELVPPEHGDYDRPLFRSQVPPRERLGRCTVRGQQSKASNIYMGHGARLSKGQVAEVVVPQPDTLELVIRISVSQANDIFGVALPSCQDERRGSSRDQLLAPRCLHGHIPTIVWTTYFGSPLTEGTRPQMHPSTGVEAQAKAVLSSREDVTLSYLRPQYNTAVGYGGQYYRRTQDLSTFMVEYRTDGEDAKFTVTQIKRWEVRSEQSPASRRTSAFKYPEAMAYPIPHIYYSTGGTAQSRKDDQLDYVIDEDSVL
ncbi:hypothetical protein H4582DRAFT_2061128 [Lactarius indigo]|nr:hypothetical protein H4582DRAFT_2061128 [Lactarius indigo]